MGYYMGDFYGGYRGDPGFLGSVWSGLKRFGAPAIGMLPVPGAGIVSKALGAAAHVKERVSTIVKAGRAIVSKHPVLTAAGAAGATVTAGAATVIARRGSSAGAGMAGTMGPGGGAGGGFGKRRRMNVCNPRALRRSIRRTHGFAKLAMKTIHLVHPTKHARFGGFKRVKHAPRRKRRA